MKKILILAGGNGSERAVSISSGKRVAEAFCRLGVRTALIDPIREIDVLREHFFTDFNALKEDSSLFGGDSGFCGNKTRALITDSVISLCKEADAVFICLHGGIGENGRLAALFECLGIKYFGSPPEGAADAMDKLRSKRIFESVGIPTPIYTTYSKNQNKPPMPPRFPCVVKPTGEGSSVGVTLVKTPAELEASVSVALRTSDTVLMEAEIKGREITVGILDDKPLAVTEIIPKGGFYDYESKYTVGKTLEITPAEIPYELTLRAMRLAERTHKALGLSGFSRIDMMIENKTNLIYVLEANTIPGMTKTSLLPLAAEYRGIDFTELCRRMAR